MVSCAIFGFGRLLNELFHDGKQFADSAYFFFDTPLEHPNKSDTLWRKRFFAQQQLEHQQCRSERLVQSVPDELNELRPRRSTKVFGGKRLRIHLTKAGSSLPSMNYFACEPLSRRSLDQIKSGGHHNCLHFSLKVSSERPVGGYRRTGLEVGLLRRDTKCN